MFLLFVIVFVFFSVFIVNVSVIVCRHFLVELSSSGHQVYISIYEVFFIQAVAVSFSHHLTTLASIELQKVSLEWNLCRHLPVEQV